LTLTPARRGDTAGRWRGPPLAARPAAVVVTLLSSPVVMTRCARLLAMTAFLASGQELRI